ncbi:hypothetical protein AB6E94_19190 [Vibrio lentus]|uniref:hypothetical protein n=1 Tax=Vibrio TaxID=662 RepID=UPI0012FFD67D|nr:MULTISPECIES: hypothetical protein [Vibrio]MCC4838080.1 hypothetical protein [Vibrio lentus]
MTIETEQPTIQELETKMQILQEAIHFAKEHGYSSVTIDIDLLEVLLKTSKSNQSIN